MSFWKPEACGQTVLPDRSVLKRQKIVENAKIQKFKYDILSNFQTMCTLWGIFFNSVEFLECKRIKLGTLLGSFLQHIPIPVTILDGTTYPSHPRESNLENDIDTLLLHPSAKFSQLLLAFLFEKMKKKKTWIEEWKKKEE